MIQPQAWVSVGGVKLTGQPSAVAPVALSGLEVSWGRTELFAQADPATVTVDVFDPTNIWAAGTDARTAGDLMGAALLVGWTHAGTDRVLFRGRIASVGIGPETRGGIDGTRVLIGGTSRIADLATQDSPARGLENVGNRLVALQSALNTYAGDAVTYVTVPGSPVSVGGDAATNHVPQNLRPTPADTSTFAALVALYDATASRLSYLPNDKWVCGIDRRTYPARRGLAGLARAAAGDARDGRGAYITPQAVIPRNAQSGTSGAPGQAPVRALYLDGRSTGRPDDAWLSRTAEQRIVRLDLTYRATTTFEDATVSRTVGRRFGTSSTLVAAAAIEVETVGAADAGSLADDYADLAASEGADWTPGPIVVDTATTGGFDSLDHALELLAGGETASLFFLQRTDYPRLQQRPLFGVMGGVITHTAGTWRIELNPTPVHTPLPQHAIAWDEIDDGTPGNTVYVYADGTLNAADGLHESVTAEDLLYCSTGLGVTAVPADSGWDTYR